MSIWKRISKLSVSQLLKLSWLFLKHPFLIIPTLKATRSTFQICDRLYGKSHHKRNKANAFRHGLWNLLICRKSMKSTKNKQKSVFWAQKVTDLYEKVTQNDPLDKAMDIHNNEIGRIYFLNNLGINEDEIIKKLQESAEKAQKVSKIEDIDPYSRLFIYLEE